VLDAPLRKRTDEASGCELGSSRRYTRSVKSLYQLGSTGFACNTKSAVYEPRPAY
jgi:hypothetical protein